MAAVNSSPSASVGGRITTRARLTGRAYGVTVKGFLLVPVPAAAVTSTGPLVVPASTPAVICLSESMSTNEAGVPLKVTLLTPVKQLPLIVTVVPTGPLAGFRLFTTGAGIVSGLELNAAPFGESASVGPVVAFGTTAVNVVPSALEVLCDVAVVPWNLTRPRFWRYLPVTVTVVPGQPFVGLILVITAG